MLFSSLTEKVVRTNKDSVPMCEIFIRTSMINILEIALDLKTQLTIFHQANSYHFAKFIFPQHEQYPTFIAILHEYVCVHHKK